MALIHSPEKYTCLKGGYGSAKTLAACILVVLLMLAIPGNLWFVGRRSYSKLHDSTLRVFMEVLDRADLEDVQMRENRDGFPHRIILPNESEAVFRETKDIGRFLGPEYGGFYLDEAQEEPEFTFTGLMGRLRLPRAGSFLKGILTTNPPPQTHWIAQRFGLHDGTRVTRVLDPTTGQTIETAWRLMTASTKLNPHLPPGYLGDLLSGLTPGEVDRVVEGNYGFSPKGPPAYPSFRHQRNVGLPDVNPNIPLVRSWDFGFRHPAVTWHQAPRCRLGKTHWNILHELDTTGVEGEELAALVLAEQPRVFPDVPRTLILDCGDVAGNAHGEHGPGPITRLARPPYRIAFRYKRCSVELDPIRKLLRSMCACGQPVVTVHQGCRNVIDAFAGGYHCPLNKPTDPPVKDGFYDDFADSVRYAFENFIRLELDGPGTLAEMAPSTEAKPAWAWMGGHASPETVAAEIARVKESMRRA
jgi:hypothetical protein